MKRHVCPWWIGYLLICPLRKFLQNPEAILKSYVRKGMTVIDIGSGMGFFTLPAARLVGENGLVIAVDIQERMVKALKRRAEKKGLSGRIAIQLSAPDDLGVTRQADLCLAFAVMHEVPDPASLLKQIAAILKPDGKLLLSEPKGHVSDREFTETIHLAERAGLTVLEAPKIARSLSVVMALQ